MDNLNNPGGQENLGPDPVLKKKKKKKRKRLNWYRLSIVILVTVFLACVTYVVATAFIRDHAVLNTARTIFEMNSAITNPGSVAFKDKDKIVVLCMGLDENRDEKGIGYTKGSRTDTMFLVYLDKKADRLGILSVPRDTWVTINDKVGKNKINSAYSDAFWNAYSGGQDYPDAKKAGVEQAKQTIEDFLGVPVDYYALLKIDATKQIVDAIGGITVDVEKDIDYDDNWGKLHIHLKKGPQRLNGENAVGYARFRHDEEGDWGRMRRQQQVMQAFVTELKKPTNVMHINRLATAITSNLDTDLPLEVMVDLANLYKKFDRNAIVRGVVPGDDDWAGDAMILVPREEEKGFLVRRILCDTIEVQPQDMKIILEDGTDKPDLVNQAAKKLEELGFGKVEVYAAQPGDHSVTEVTDFFQNSDGIQMLQGSLGMNFGKIVHKAPSHITEPCDFIITLGKDFGEKGLGESGGNTDKARTSAVTR